MTIILLFMFSSLLPHHALTSESVGESTAYTVSSEMDGVRLMRLNMLDVLQKELTELKAKYENKEKEKHVLEENIRKIQTNHEEEIKEVEVEFERKREACVRRKHQENSNEPPRRNKES